jgi:hypothetical protein
LIDKLTYVLPAVTGLLYLGTSAAFLVKKKPEWALTYFAYALANVGLIWASLR